MLRVGLAPCSPFTVTSELMIAAAKLARQYEGVRLHTHLAENQVRGSQYLAFLTQSSKAPALNVQLCEASSFLNAIFEITNIPHVL